LISKKNTAILILSIGKTKDTLVDGVSFFCMSIVEIQGQINQRGDAYRSEIAEAISIYNDPENVVSNMTQFINSTELSDDKKRRILEDLESYL